MQRGSMESDYTVTIGLGKCNDLKLTTNSLVCALPEIEPETLENNARTDGGLYVNVSEIPTQTYLFIHMSVFKFLVVSAFVRFLLSFLFPLSLWSLKIYALFYDYQFEDDNWQPQRIHRLPEVQKGRGWCSQVAQVGTDWCWRCTTYHISCSCCSLHLEEKAVCWTPPEWTVHGSASKPRSGKPQGRTSPRSEREDNRPQGGKREKWDWTCRPESNRQ